MKQTQVKEWDFCSESEEKVLYKFRRHEARENVDLLILDIIDSLLNPVYEKEENKINRYILELLEVDEEIYKIKINMKSENITLSELEDLKEFIKTCREDRRCINKILTESKRELKNKIKSCKEISIEIQKYFNVLDKRRKSCNFYNNINGSAYISYYYNIDRFFIEDFVAKFEDLVYNIDVDDRENILKQIFEIKKDLINNVKYTNMIGE